MEDFVQLKAAVPRLLKRKVYAKFAMRDLKFQTWLNQQLQTWLDEVEETERREADDAKAGVASAAGD
jgi:hypothetical protein